MKTFRLSSSSERTTGILFSAVMILCMGLLLYALRSQLLVLIMAGLGVLLLSAGLIIYVLSVSKAECIFNSERNQLTVKSFPSDYTVDLSNAAMLQTVPRKIGHTATRALLLTDTEGKVLTSIPTFFTANQGVQAEPLAKEMAQTMGLAFQANLEEWEYDKEKRKEHEAQLALQEKEENKARREAKIRYMRKKLLSRASQDESQPAAAEEKVSQANSSAEDGINYDAMDDET